ncbi:MAG: hypothetical protein AAF915_25995 [Cyanobacteria bacterium P01_D01_bin.50]
MPEGLIAIELTLNLQPDICLMLENKTIAIRQWSIYNLILNA